jgi:hypothetical protein
MAPVWSRIPINSNDHFCEAISLDYAVGAASGSRSRGTRAAE